MITNNPMQLEYHGGEHEKGSLPSAPWFQVYLFIKERENGINYTATADAITLFLTFILTSFTLLFGIMCF
nr:hypothetical protein [uncultured Mogibacterium sp.]